jgi:hypothetical protein
MMECASIVVVVVVVVVVEDAERIQQKIDSTMCSKRCRFDGTSFLTDEPMMI